MRRFANRSRPAGLRAMQDAGLTVVELLVSSMITLLVLAAVVQNISDSAKRSRDNEVISRANEVARAILDYMVFDVRLLGAGMPLGQQLFPLYTFAPSGSATIPPPPNWGTAGLYPFGDANWPLLPGSDATHIHIRLNVRGIETVLQSEFDPAATNTLSVFDTSDFAAGDIIYISDRRLKDTAGMRAQVAGKTANSLTISSAPNTTLDPLGQPWKFPSGSAVNRVSTVSYVSPAGSDWSGVRIAISDYDANLRVIYPNTQFSIIYRDKLGNTMTLPSTVSSSAEVSALLTQLLNLESVQITVTARGETALSDGTTYTAVATQRVGVRNLHLSYAT